MGGSDDEAASTDRCGQERLPQVEARFFGSCAMSDEMSPCGFYRPGHQTHWIQMKKSQEDDQPIILLWIRSSDPYDDLALRAPLLDVGQSFGGRLEGKDSIYDRAYCAGIDERAELA